jgi:hypothetical protein
MPASTTSQDRYGERINLLRLGILVELENAEAPQKTIAEAKPKVPFSPWRYSLL